MKTIFLHDWCGHPFQVQLSRALARRGYRVEHAYFAEFQGPKGALARRDNDPTGFSLHPVRLARVYAKYSYLRRWFQDRDYGRRVARRIRDLRPDVVISSNTPLDAQAALMRASRDVGARFVFWLQDIQNIAMRRILPGRLPGLGRLVASHYERIEHRLLADSDHVVCICSDFANYLGRGARTSVIENWAPRDEIFPLPKDNAWSRRHGLQDRMVFLYAGTLGRKHNPELLRALAADCAHHPDATLVVASEGLGADWLRQRKSADGLDRLMLLPYQPYDDVPTMLATGDVLICIIDADAGEFSVPSKVLSYMAAGRALLLSVPGGNSAARLVRNTRSGLVTEPGATADFLAAARRLLRDDGLRAESAANACRHADHAFDIKRIAGRFVSIIEADDLSEPAAHSL